jgi:hypothetical protein
MSAYLIDTNVMLAASAIFNLSNLANEASPVEVELREIVFNTLKSFEDSDDRLVLDYEGSIRDEYERNMPFNTTMQTQEYGMLVLQKKLDYNEVDWVTIDIQDANGELVATVHPNLEAIVADRADRKWVASAVAHRELLHSESPIVYGAETDWFKIEAQLAEYGIQMKRLLPVEWYENKLDR